LKKLPMLFAPHMEHTFGEGPMVDLDRMARAFEKAGGPIKSVSYFPVQPWLDVADMGFAAVVVADGDQEAATVAAERLVAEAWKRRRDFDVTMTSVDEAVSTALALSGGPVILADTSDCVGGGSTGDGAELLEAILRLAGDIPALIHIVDPTVAEQAHAAGKGAVLNTAIGNRINTLRGSPVPVTARVSHVFDGSFTYDGGFLGGVTASMGRSAVLTVGPICILVATYASYEWGFEPYRAAGLDVRSAKLVSVKNPMNYRLTYPFAAAAFVVDTKGPTTPDFCGLTWHNLRRPFFPIDDVAGVG
jgi:microcystin degradation protein MlrC